MTINELEPKVVWNNFYKLTRCPRPSKHEEIVRAFLLEWGKEHNIEAFVDETGNVIMKAPATPGFENRKTVVLQGHMDMVPQKTPETVHDFLKDPIETVIDGDWVKAKGTTLGADNGMGVALAMAVLEDPTVQHGPIEVLVTYDEETGMTGASSLKPGVLDADILINLDSEEEGEFYVGCAGGLDAHAFDKYELKAQPEGYECCTLEVGGCQGGHSGMDINLYRANANKVGARLLNALLTEADVKLLDFEGGNMRNAIPRDCVATLYVKDPAQAKAIVERVGAEIKAEYAETDPNMAISFGPYVAAEGECCCGGDECKYVEEGKALKYVQAILACPDGVERMSASVPGLVETSNNLAIVKIEGGVFDLITLMRSSVDTAKQALADKFAALFALAGIESDFAGGYSGWAPNPKSEIRSIMTEVYTKKYGQEPKIMAIHAGLECGILSGAYPHWDMVSMGPTLRSPHSPDERCFIPAVGKVWDFLKDVLVAIPEK